MLERLLLSMVVAGGGLGMAPPPAVAQPAGEKPVFLACYVFNPGRDVSAIAFMPYQTTASALKGVDVEAKAAKTGVQSAAPYRTARCARFDTADEGLQWYRQSGYHMLNRMGYPKGFWPEPAAAPPKPSGPPKWAVCTLETSGGVGTKLAMFVFEPFQVAAARAPIPRDVGMLFHHEVGAGTVVSGYQPFNGNGSGSCNYHDDEASARARRDRWLQNRDYGIVKFVAWRPSADLTGLGAASGPARVTGTAGGPGDPKSTSGVTVTKADTSLREAGKAWDEQVRKALAEEARKKVELAARSVQADTKGRQELEAFFKARRGNRGNAQ